MPYLVSTVNISLDYPVYVRVPEELDYDDILDLIDYSDSAWSFADDDVVSAVEKAIPTALSVMPDVGASDEIVDSYPDGSFVYDLERISTPKEIRDRITAGVAERFKSELEEALRNDDFEEVARISAELIKLMK